ncbi:hypothetical protein HS125_16950 [bacterium]|nr:hypothetical protein [bacterium]
MTSSTYPRNPYLDNEPLPVDIVLHPSWWNRHEGISFDPDFFFHPVRRIEDERRMERALYERWGRFGLGENHQRDLPQVGAVHLAAGFLLSEMMGCPVRYEENSSPTVMPADRTDLRIDVDAAFRSPVWKKYETMLAALKEKHGYLTGDANWSGILNLGLDLRGQDIFIDILERPDQTRRLFAGIAELIERFTAIVSGETHSTSISVNRNVRHIPKPVFLHSECTHTMISNQDYRSVLWEFDRRWNAKYRPYGIHFCGSDPHRFAEDFAALPGLDFLDVGWGGDVKTLRAHLPQTFLNIRLSPVEMVHKTQDEVRAEIRRLVKDSDNPYLTGVCCINMDDQVPDATITAIFETVAELRREYATALA